MAPPDAAVEHYRSQQRLAVVVLAGAVAQWQRMSTDFDASWARIVGALLRLLMAGQLAAARSGADYVPRALAEQGIDVAPDGDVRASGFVGVASDGRPLDSLLYSAVTHAKQAAARMPAEAALRQAQPSLERIVRTQLADAARESAGVAIAARRNVGWVRMVNPPCCGACAVLAGRFYRWSSGFERHVACDCRHIPTSEDVAGDLVTDPKALLAAGQITDLSKADLQALEEGADLGRIVNVRRDRWKQRVNAARRPRSRGPVLKPTPADIYQAAKGDREVALSALRDEGYLL